MAKSGKRNRGPALCIDRREVRAYCDPRPLTDEQCDDVIQLFADEHYPDALAAAVEQVLAETQEEEATAS